ncbi:hypothetical protein V6U78_11510 [Marinospirillum sp. MEB164]|uniref:Uncharacterized protein n=1 Tax=Marinospirillum alkalitolerans TaxID=3123374 RepID=A0ABW8Q0J8_9GAMM
MSYPIFPESIQRVPICSSGQSPFIGVNVRIRLSPQVPVATHDLVQLPYLGPTFTRFTYTT